MKTGLVSKKQAHQAKKDKKSKNKKQRATNKAQADETKKKIQQAAREKAEQDRQLNKQKDQQARIKAIEAEIDQLITNNIIPRDDTCDIGYHFEHQNKVKNIYLNNELKQHLIEGKLGIAMINERYELVAKAIAEKINERNEQRIILIEKTDETMDDDDPYADYQIPDDLMW